eukprot:TRINITY_DN67081_c10_g1_i1.p1 TRINITY_DN67081_c10_g1~~TRINITY_DN67081_c10_g1_i1.p1  ORF type:complete len:797 (-),score=76.62 TRINITY_DN67081_c10_g1_i1:32-2086(-)
MAIGDLVYLLQTIKYRYTLTLADQATEPMPVEQRLSKLRDEKIPQQKELTSFFRFSAAPECDEPEDEDAGAPPAGKKMKKDPAPSRVPTDERPMCSDGPSCQQNTKRHFMEYRHPHLPTLASEVEMADECSSDDEKPAETKKKKKVAPNSQTLPLELTDSEDSDAAGAPTKTTKVPCPYGAQCYRKNSLHRQQYSHDFKQQQKKMPEGQVPETRPMCPYGATCYRANQHHRRMYYHPPAATPQFPQAVGPPSGATGPPAAGAPAATPAAAADTTPKDGVGVGGGPLFGGNGNGTVIAPPSDLDPKAPKPRNWLADGDLYLIGPPGTNQYKLKNAGGIWYCTCASWRYQNKGPDERNCKHLEEFLGLEYNNWRIKEAQGGGGDDDMPLATATATTTTTTTTTAGGGGGAIFKQTKKLKSPAVLLAQKWEEKTDPKGYLVSEKLDGVRAWWDGTQFISRLGNVYHAPEYFRKEMPENVVLDGELFGGRKRFQFTVGVVKSSAKSALWKQITYQVFDAPEIQKPFDERLEWLHKNLGESKGLEFVRVVEHWPCKGRDQLKADLKAVEAKGGEGLMLRQPKSQYIGQRSSTLLKVKSFKDYEARVIAHEPGKGKYVGMTGALTCELPNGKKFSVGSGMTDKDRGSPPRVGTVITFRFTELTDAGIPRFPRYLGVKADAKWPPDAPWPP